MLNIPREPDMSIPSTVQGATLSEVLIPPPDADKTRNETIMSMQRSKLNSTRTLISKLSLEQQLSYCQVIS